MKAWVKDWAKELKRLHLRLPRLIRGGGPWWWQAAQPTLRRLAFAPQLLRHAPHCSAVALTRCCCRLLSLQQPQLQRVDVCVQCRALLLSLLQLLLQPVDLLLHQPSA